MTSVMREEIKVENLYPEKLKAQQSVAQVSFWTVQYDVGNAGVLNCLKFG